MFKSKFFIIFKTLVLVIKIKQLSPKNRKKTFKMEKIIQSIWKFQVHIFRWQVISVQIFRKIYAPRTCVGKIMYTGGSQTDGQRRTDRRTRWNQYNPKTSFAGGLKNYQDIYWYFILFYNFTIYIVLRYIYIHYVLLLY